MEIRPEEKEDIKIIHDLTAAAFKDMPFSDQDEPFVIDRLRENGVLSVSLVAIKETQILGHIAFSPVTIDGRDSDCWFGLGPVSVWPEHQHQGIGTALINEGVKRLKVNLKANGCVLLGDPNYYSRFGFACDPNLTYTEAPAEYFQRLAFGSKVPEGEVQFHSSFDKI